jgi:hypothetical protein
LRREVSIRGEMKRKDGYRLMAPAQEHEKLMTPVHNHEKDLRNKEGAQGGQGKGLIFNVLDQSASMDRSEEILDIRVSK